MCVCAANTVQRILIQDRYFLSAVHFVSLITCIYYPACLASKQVQLQLITAYKSTLYLIKVSV